MTAMIPPIVADMITIVSPPGIVSSIILLMNLVLSGNYFMTDW